MDKFVRTGSISYFGPESMDTEKILRDKILNKTYDSPTKCVLKSILVIGSGTELVFCKLVTRIDVRVR